MLADPADRIKKARHDELHFSARTNESSFQEQSEMLSWRCDEKDEGEKASSREESAQTKSETEGADRHRRFAQGAPGSRIRAGSMERENLRQRSATFARTFRGSKEAVDVVAEGTVQGDMAIPPRHAAPHSRATIVAITVSSAKAHSSLSSPPSFMSLVRSTSSPMPFPGLVFWTTPPSFRWR